MHTHKDARGHDWKTWERPRKGRCGRCERLTEIVLVDGKNFDEPLLGHVRRCWECYVTEHASWCDCPLWREATEMVRRSLGYYDDDRSAA